MPAKHVVDITILNCGGLADLMSEMEASFLVSALALFRNAPDFKKGEPRAKVTLARVYKPRDFHRMAYRPADILHVIGHAKGDELQAGIAERRITAAELGMQAEKAHGRLPPVVVSTGCKLQSSAWQQGMKAAGAEILIASANDVSPASLTAFDMAFYSALLVQVRKNTEFLDRVTASFKLANEYYRAIHAEGTPRATFSLERL
jgi:N-methylhydantoinase A/oxoprolinase/acetone carboxylase beta subunit